MKKLILYFLFGVTLVSCNFLTIPMTEDVTYAFTSDKKPETRTNDTIYFKDSGKNLKDTFLLDVFVHSHVNDNVTYYKASYYYMVLNRNRRYRDIYVNISSIDYNKSFFFEQYTQDVPTSFEKKNTITSFVLNDQTYSSVDVFSNRDSTNADFIPNIIYFSCKYGILRYEYLDGRVYELVNK